MMLKILLCLVLSLFYVEAKNMTKETTKEEVKACLSIERTKIGQHAQVEIKELHTSYLGRIDTGARVTSLHARNIKLLVKRKKVKPRRQNKKMSKIKNAHYTQNVGKIISFETENEKGKKSAYQAKVIDVSLVKNAQGREYRYIIQLTLSYKGVSKHIRVNLRDRSHMRYKLLIGRNWLHNDFYVVTDHKPME